MEKIGKHGAGRHASQEISRVKVVFRDGIGRSSAQSAKQKEASSSLPPMSPKCKTRHVWHHTNLMEMRSLLLVSLPRHDDGYGSLTLGGHAMKECSRQCCMPKRERGFPLPERCPAWPALPASPACQFSRKNAKSNHKINSHVITVRYCFSRGLAHCY